MMQGSHEDGILNLETNRPGTGKVSIKTVLASCKGCPVATRPGAQLSASPLLGLSSHVTSVTCAPQYPPP